jgi:hypothetical protein
MLDEIKGAKIASLSVGTLDLSKYAITADKIHSISALSQPRLNFYMPWYRRVRFAVQLLVRGYINWSEVTKHGRR